MKSLTYKNESSNFNVVSFHHIYREMNEDADVLSKASSQMEYGLWHMREIKYGEVVDYFLIFQLCFSVFRL
jgi:hypothetical protein